MKVVRADSDGRRVSGTNSLAGKCRSLRALWNAPKKLSSTAMQIVLGREGLHPGDV